MKVTPDVLIDRRSLRRELSIWRIMFVAVAILSLLTFMWQWDNDFSIVNPPHILRVSINGFINDDRQRDEDLLDIINRENTKAVILSIDSYGGTTSGSEALFETFRKIAAVKPVVATIGNAATSGGYIVAMSADHIIARKTTITGSIGVIFEWPQLHDLLDKWGISMKTVKSSPFKGEPRPFSKTPEDAIQNIEDLIQDSYDWFLNLVSERRQIDMESTRIIGDGRVYTGRQALDLNLIDAIGGEQKARDWLAAEHDISYDLNVHDWDWNDRRNWDWNDSNVMNSPGVRIMHGLAASLGLQDLLAPFGRISTQITRNSDGLLSVWQLPPSRDDQ